jgi:hypothetical protein
MDAGPGPLAPAKKVGAAQKSPGAWPGFEMPSRCHHGRAPAQGGKAGNDKPCGYHPKPTLADASRFAMTASASQTLGFYNKVL